MWNFSQKFCTQIGTRHLKATTGSPRPHDCCRLNYISPCDTLVRVCCIQIDAGYLRTMAWGVFRALETVMWYPNVLYGSHLSCLLSKEKYHCTADLQFILFGFSRLCWISNRFTCWVKSKPVKQEFTCTVILSLILLALKYE